MSIHFQAKTALLKSVFVVLMALITQNALTQIIEDTIFSKSKKGVQVKPESESKNIISHIIAFK